MCELTAIVDDSYQMPHGYQVGRRVQCIGGRLFDRQRRTHCPSWIEVDLAQCFPSRSRGGFIALVENLEAHEAHVLASRVCSTEEACRDSQVVSLTRRDREALEGERDDEVAANAGGHFERVVGVALEQVFAVAFNDIHYQHLGDLPWPAGAADRTALPIAGNDPGAKKQAAKLLSLLGYDSVDMGPLTEAGAHDRALRSSASPPR
jgi:hypothetical protein